MLYLWSLGFGERAAIHPGRLQMVHIKITTNARDSIKQSLLKSAVQYVSLNCDVLAFHGPSPLHEDPPPQGFS